MIAIEQLFWIISSSAGVSIDTRTITPGQVFFALRGENSDGNKYAAKALEAGAAWAVVDNPVDESPLYIRVDDSLEALKAVAEYHRKHISNGRLRVIGLTGTNGKTTTKELLRAALSARYRVVATEGNLNNEIGVPLSVLKIRPDTEIAIIEMGASHPDDLVPLLKVAKPDIGLITNVGKAHLLGFGSFEGVKHAKGLLYDYLAANHGRALLNADDPDLSLMARERGLDTVPYGLDAQGYKILPTTPQDPMLSIDLGGTAIHTRLVGAYNAPNVLAALAAADLMGVPRPEACAAIEAYSPSNNRSQLVRTAKNTVICDLYNANPSSMAVAIDNLSRMEAGRKGVLLGDMRELGAESVTEHAAVLRKVLAAGFDRVYLVGEEFMKAARGVPEVTVFPDSEALAKFIGENPLSGYTLLVKGSRGIMMEKVLPSL